MVFKVFLDANVLLDFLLKRDHYEDARDIMNLVIEGKVNAYITPAIVHIIGYWLTKAYGSEKAKRLLLSLLDNVRAIDISHELTLLALNSKIDGIEDAFNIILQSITNWIILFQGTKSLKSQRSLVCQ